ncbi:MAG: universal stress protein [Deltaproteobacteria bacterium]|jgi:nucleotide-binding universal stress UspA family protein|nr:universal stress protein [Deltaproteobacteria bacterium]
MSDSLFNSIAFCTDFSENADEAFRTAKDLAWRYGAQLHIIHVMVNFSLSPPIHSTYMPIEYDPQFIEQVTLAAKESIQQRYIAKLKEKQPYETHLLSGYASSEILRLAKEKHFDLIVMGSHGLTGIAHVLFGSTADRVVRKAPCSVLTVRLPQGKTDMVRSVPSQ